MTRADIQAKVDQYVAAWERHDIDGLLECYAPDADIASPMFRKLHGLDAIEAQFQDLFRTFGKLTFDVRDVVIDAAPARAALYVASTSTHSGSIFGFPPTGQDIATNVLFILHFDESGKIVSDRRLYDFTALLIKLGVLKAKTA